MTELQACFLSLVRGALFGEEKKPLPEGIKEKDLYKMAQWHSVTAAVASQIENPKDKNLQTAEDFARGMWQMQDAALQELLEAFSDIPAVPLNGAVLQSLWKKPYLRQMCDIDILVSKDDLHSCRITMEKLGYETLVGDKNRAFSFTKVPYMNVILHASLYPRGSAFQRAFKANGYFLEAGEYPFRHMRESGCYAMLCCNLLYAFIGAGIGVRLLADFWLWHHSKEHYHKAQVRAFFADLGYGRFLDNLEDLTEVWFGGKAPTEATDLLSDHILSLGQKDLLPAKDFGKPRWAGFTRPFLPKKEMRLRYPVLSSRPGLLLFCYLHRFFLVLFHRKANFSHYWRASGNASHESGEKQKEWLHQIGL